MGQIDHAQKIHSRHYINMMFFMATHQGNNFSYEISVCELPIEIKLPTNPKPIAITKSEENLLLK